ncbi:MAG: O-acetyl-ADP-ribose deacetylase [Bacteroidales bacterium]|nr:MAG: O-acetyl-ADP-ribose deacetylase [Bacteroidales bacterium]
MGSIEVIQGDITKLNVDAIVNAANESLLGGGGVDGAIHDAAGEELLDECRKIGGCPTGEARITKGYLLPVKFIIHTVGPIWNGGYKDEIDLLRSAYQNSLKLASSHGVETIAFPNISTGVYGFPKKSAVEIAVNAVRGYISKNALPKKVIFVCFDEENYEIYREKIIQK